MGLSSLIALENVSMRFSIPHERVDSLRNALLTFWKKRTYETFYALKDVSFTADPGEFLGIIGKNGAGKTVLLKIIAGIYRPTAGRVLVRGAVSSFLELWTGMQAELSGRDNISLYGALLGLTRRRVREKFDEILGFSELGPFIDLKLKHYSSGMQARLAFSVAIQADVPILLVDEVLAVGDASFIPKCLDRIDDFRRRKKTILFVSHGLATVEKICDKVVFLKNGRIAAIGEPKRVVNAYLQDIAEKQEKAFVKKKGERTPARDMGDERREDRWGKREIEIRKVTLRNLQGLEKHVFSPEEGLAVEMDVVSSAAIKDFVFGIGVYDSRGVSCYGTNTNIEEFKPLVIQGEGKVVCRIEKLNLINGTYYLDVAVHKIDGYPYDYHRSLYSFLVSSTLNDVGIARLPHAWSFSPAIEIKK